MKWCDKTKYYSRYSDDSGKVEIIFLIHEDEKQGLFCQLKILLWEFFYKTDWY